MKPYERNVWLYRLFMLFVEPLFWGPIVITSLQKLAGMSLPEIYSMEAKVVLLCVLLDVPAGALADIIGRKKTLIIAQIFLLWSIIGFATMTSSQDAWIANITWGIGTSFFSGADTSLLAESLIKLNRRNEYKKIVGSALGWKFLVFAFSCLISGKLAAIDLRLPLLLSIPGVCIALITTFFFIDSNSPEKYSMKKQYQTIAEGFLFAVRNRAIRWIVGFGALIWGASKIWFFTYNPYFEIVGLKVEEYGVIFFLLNIVAWLSSLYAQKIEEKLKESKCILMMIGCLGIPIMFMSLLPYKGITYFVLFQNIVRGFAGPFIGDYINRHIKSDHIRATVNSFKSSTSSAISFFTLQGFGDLVHGLGVLHAMMILGSTVTLLGTLCFWRYKVLQQNHQDTV